MERASKLAVALIGMLLVAACQDTPTGLADPALDEIDLPTHATHDDIDEQEGGESVDPFVHRIVFTFTAEGNLSPNSPATLVIEGVAIEPLVGGEVTVTLPTKAAMDYAGSDDALYFPAGRRLPVAGQWTLPAMAAGQRWRQRITVPAMAMGYYQLALNADTRGPPGDLGRFLIDDVYSQVWMFISDRGAALTPFFDETVFPENARPVPGPIETPNLGRDGGASAAYAASSRWIYTEVSYYAGSDDGYQPAADAEITGAVYTNGRKGVETTYTVPASGIIRWTCPSAPNTYLGGDAEVPATDHVKRGKKRLVLWWSSRSSECGDTISAIGRRDVYMPWDNLNKSAEIIEREFGHSRSPVEWKVDHDYDGAKYTGNWGRDYITFGTYSYYDRWAAAHEFGHAFHNKALGGMWKTHNCANHSVFRVSSYTCAFSEGFADYAGDVGAPDDTYLEEGWEDFSTREPGVHGKIEEYVAALFHDLIDGGTETDDETEYQGAYIATVFKTCKTAGTRSGWKARNDVADFVWCLENRINEDVHDDHFPGLTAPARVKESATEPDDWDADDIRSTWLLNLRG